MSKIVPFGKYKDQPVETLIADRGYCEWLAAQPWFAERFRDLHQIVINYGAEPQDTPAHNRLQAMFLDPTICFRLASLVKPEWVGFEAKAVTFLEENAEWRDATRQEVPVTYQYGFEVSGWDVYLKFNGGIIYTREAYALPSADVNTYYKSFGPHGSAIMIECKPLVGDDYPTILRQIQRYPGWGDKVLLLEVFDARGATFEQVKEIFSCSKIKLVLLNEIDLPPWED